MPKTTYFDPVPVILTYFITPQSRVLREKLTASLLVKKLPAFYGTRNFIVTFTSARHLSSGASFGKWDNYFLMSLKSC
jgi:hypothetical protein